MIRLPRSLAALGQADFREVLKAEIEGLDGRLLPLQQGLTHSSYALTEPFRVMIIDVAELPKRVEVKVGVFYQGLIPGCACADDPTPEDEYDEYCELCFDIDRDSGEALVSLCDS